MWATETANMPLRRAAIYKKIAAQALFSQTFIAGDGNIVR